MTLPPHHRKNEPSNNLITITIAPLFPNRRINRRVSKSPTRPIPTSTLTAIHFLPPISNTQTPSLHSPPQDPQPDTDGTDTANPRPVGRVAGTGYVPVLSEGVRQGESSPPHHRKNEPPINLITTTIASLFSTRRTIRCASKRPPSPILTTPLTATHFSPSTPSTQTPSLHPPPQDPPPDIGGIDTAPPWPEGRVATTGYVPVLSDHDRGFMQPRPASMKGGRHRDESDASRRWIRESQQRSLEVTTVRVYQQQGIPRGSGTGDHQLLQQFVAPHPAHRPPRHMFHLPTSLLTWDCTLQGHDDNVETITALPH